MGASRHFRAFLVSVRHGKASKTLDHPRDPETVDQKAKDPVNSRASLTISAVHLEKGIIKVRLQ
jgi:hypothetical protein